MWPFRRLFATLGGSGSVLAGSTLNWQSRYRTHSVHCDKSATILQQFWNICECFVLSNSIDSRHPSVKIELFCIAAFIAAPTTASWHPSQVAVASRVFCRFDAASFNSHRHLSWWYWMSNTIYRNLCVQIWNIQYIEHSSEYSYWHSRRRVRAQEFVFPRTYYCKLCCRVNIRVSVRR